MGFLSKSIVGVEMDSCEIRAVELKGTVKKPEITAWGRIALPAGCVRDGRVASPVILAEYLQKLWDSSRFKSKDIILGINNQDVIIRFASFPKVPEDKVRNMIMFQAQEFIPVSLEDLQLDYVIVGEKKNDDGEFLNVILVGARKRMLQDYVEAITTAKLTVHEIDSGMMAVGRAALGAINRDVYAVVGYNHDIANIMIFNKGILSMARSIPFSQSSLWNGRKSEADPKQNGAVIAEILIGELRSSIGYYRMQNQDNIEGIYLIGIPQIKDMIDRFREAGYEASIVQPYSDIPIKNQANTLLSFKAADYAAAVSLGLRGLEG